MKATKEIKQEEAAMSRPEPVSFAKEAHEKMFTEMSEMIDKDMADKIERMPKSLKKEELVNLVGYLGNGIPKIKE